MSSSSATPRFVVGTGRCGSTLLSLMLAQHQDVVSLHEFFTGLDWGRRFRPGEVSGDELADLIGAEQPVTTEVIARGHTSDEIQYPFDSPKARFRKGDAIPWLLVTMLSRLTDDPDPLFDDVRSWARARPGASLGAHYSDLFAMLTERCGGSVWIERSGSSIDYLGELATMFPDAKFVHIQRDGHEAALSIRAHPFFRLGVAFLLDLVPDLDDADAAITAIIDNPPPCWAVGRYWSDQLLHGLPALAQLDRDQYLEVRFEELLAEPGNVLARIAEFFELPEDAGFADRGASLVGEPPRPRFGDLTPEEQVELAEACRPGQVLLGRKG